MAKGTYRPWLLALAGALGGAAVARWQLARWFTPQPRYELERRVGDLEIRVYGAGWVAETTVRDASWEQALNEGFRRLARYIFGKNHPSPFQPARLGASEPTRSPAALRADDGNDSGYQIPMPVPVGAPTFARKAQKLAMTAPVNVTTHEDRAYTIVFNLPRDRTLASLPAPDDERVRLERRPRRRVAVLRYSGGRSGPLVAAKFSELLARVRAERLPYRGSPEFAGYDPPSTLPFLRRNEVWVELEPAWT
jgi:SOUL heme-binding protein